MEKAKFNFDQTKFKVVKNNRGSQRGELLDKFLSHLNPAREKDGYPKLTHPGLSTILAGKKTDDLYIFYKQCLEAKMPFSAYFFWRLKEEKLKTKQ